MAEIRQRSKAEVVFGVMRALLRGRLLWGGKGCVPVSSLRPLTGASPWQIGRALTYLRNEGMVRVDRRRDMVFLTERAMRELTEKRSESRAAAPGASS